MIIRRYNPAADFDVLRGWIADARAHALWCANRMAYPLERANFEAVLRDIAGRFGDMPYVAVAEGGGVVGFFCYSLNPDTREGMLKFVVIDPARRGQGLGKAMLRLALARAFNAGAKAVQLYVFPENVGAVKCYEGVGFSARRTEPGVFRYLNEAWDRRNMVRAKPDDPEEK